MKSKIQQLNKNLSSSSHKIISLSSQYLFIDLFSTKKYQQPTFLIPDTILLQKGHIKQWLFNSLKQQNKILKKKKQNCTPLNVVKSFCMKAGFNFNNARSILEIKNEIQQYLKERQINDKNLTYKREEDKKVMEILTIDDNFFSFSIIDFVLKVQENKYNEHIFYEKWKIIRQKVNNESRIDQYYQVQNFRKNHLIQSKCRKVIALQNTQLNQVSSTDLDDGFRSGSPSKELSAVQTKNIQEYKFFDTYLNKKFFKISQQFIQFVQKNYKCIVQQVKTAFVINKNRQPHLIGIYNLKIKPVKRICQDQEFEAYAERGYVRIQEYMRCLNAYLLEYQDSIQTSFKTSANIVKKHYKCYGDFCQIKVKKLPHLIDPGSSLTGRFKEFGLNPTSHPLNKRTILNEMLIAVRKKRAKVLQKLKANEIVEYNPDYQQNDSSEYEQNDDDIKKEMRVCDNCNNVYAHIQMFYDIDFRNGNLIQRKQASLNPSLRTRAQSQRKHLPPLINKNQTQPILPSKQQNQRLQQILKKVEKQNHQKQQPKARSISVRAKSQTKFITPIKQQGAKYPLQNKQLFQDIKKIKLNPIQSSGTKQQISSKGSRLMALSKSIQGLQLRKGSKIQQNNFEKKLNKMPKAKNIDEAENNLFQKLSLLPSSSREEFIYYAKKYYKDNLPQQLERKSYSSQFIPHLYEFMLNSDLSVHPKNKIRKRPQISLKRLSELTDFPQIVSKSAFKFDTIITDEKTTISFCVITTKMINGKNAVNVPYENIIIVNDIFDSFIEYIPLVKDILQNAVNKRVILFNYPGQSHTIYNHQIPFNLPQFSFILDKLLYRISTEKEQLGFINFRKDKLKFIGFGYGGYILTQYIANTFDFYQQNLTGLLLINTYKTITQIWEQKLQALLSLYKSNQQVAVSQAYLFYSRAIQSSQMDKQDLQYKAGLNPIRNQGRVYLLQSLLQNAKFEHNHHNTMVENFQNVNTIPVQVIYGRSNVLFTKAQAQRFLIYQDTKLGKEEIPQRKFIQLEGGHDLMADNYDDLEKYIQAFANL